MSQVYEEDILGAGKSQVIIGNGDTKVIIVPELGGRIADVQSGEVGFLYRTYPEGVNFGPYTEYGGIEECIGGAPGTLWNTRWKWEHKDDGVLLQALSKRTLVRKFISLDQAEPIIRVNYSFSNFGDNFSKFTFGIHPEICIGGSLRDNRYHVPTGGELLNGAYVEPGFKSKLLPSEGWCAITHDGKVFGQMFPEGIIDVIEIYYPKVDTHMVLEPIIFSIGISPGKYAGFMYMMYMGDGEAETIKEMRASRDAELSVKYETFDRDEMPEEVMAELGEMAQEREVEGEVRPRFRPEFHPEPKVIPIVPIVGSVIGEAVEKVAEIVNAKAASSPADRARSQQTGRTEDLPPDTEVVIEHLHGKITIHGWERSHIEYADVRGALDQDEEAVRIRASGDYSLKLPRQTPRISLNFVNGHAALFDIASSLKISGVNGKIDVVSAEVPADGTLDASLVSGDISLSIPGDASCRISAISLSGGDITCNDIELEESVNARGRLTGVMNDGTATIRLSTVKGNILINQTVRGENNE